MKVVKKMGYILPISINHPYWKIEKTPIKLYALEKVKNHFQPASYKIPYKKERTIRNQISNELYFELTGKGRYVNVLK